MDVQHLLCGIGSEKLRNLGFFKLPSLRFPQFRVDATSTTPSPTNTPIGPKPHRRHLPVGTGPYTVGCVDLMSDHTVKGTFIRMYYPTQHTDVFKREAQWPLWIPRKQYGKGYAYFRRKNTKVYGTFINILGGDVYVPVLWQAPVLGNKKFPVIVFSHGIGGNRTTYTTICSDLASHGYIVAAIEHRDGSASMTFCLRPTSATTETTTQQLEKDYRFLYRNHSFREEHWLKYERQEVEDDYDVRNKQVHMRVKEIQQVYDLLHDINQGQKVENVLGAKFDFTQFKGACDMSRAAVVGHSFGGSTTVATLAADKRFKAGVALDSWMHPLEDELYDKVTQPLLMINSETFQWPQNVLPMLKLRMNANNNKAERVLLTLSGTCHQSMSDFQFVVSSRFGKFMELRHATEPAVAMDLNQKATRGFLAKHMNIPGADHHENIVSGLHELVILGTNLDLELSQQSE